VRKPVLSLSAHVKPNASFFSSAVIFPIIVLRSPPSVEVWEPERDLSLRERGRLHEESDWARHLRAKPLSRQSQSASLSNDPAKRLSLEQDRTGHDLQARTSRREKVGIVSAVTTSCRKSSSVLFNNKIEVVKSQAQAAFA